MKKISLLIVAIWGTLCFGKSFAQTLGGYSGNSKLKERINLLSKQYPVYFKADILTKTAGNSDIWKLTIGTGKTESKPAIAIVAGVEGNRLISVELALGFAENLLKKSTEESVKNLLETHTFYVFPNMSPDATEQYFSKTLQYERLGNKKSLDYDRDGQAGEDGYDDLDGDKKITFIRVEDPSGTYIQNPEEPRSMVKANIANGEKGKYLLFTEGYDNDKDGNINEDPEEGVCINRNSTYQYKNFVPGAGEHAVSEPENRALFDFLYDAFNIYAVVTFGPDNNLSKPVKVAATPPAKGKELQNWYKEDAEVNAFVSSLYNNVFTDKNTPETEPVPGNFVDWAYYHYGRYSFSTPGWWIPKPENATKAKRNDPVATYLKWAESQGITNTFKEWTTVQHPDFPNRKAEVGGIHPFVLYNPPYNMVADIVGKHSEFIISLVKESPKLKIVDIKKETLSDGLTRVSLRIFNDSEFPVLTKVGERSYFLKKIGVKVSLSGNQKAISGKQRQAIDNIEGKGYTDLNWIISGKGKIQIEVTSATAGNDYAELSI